MKSAIQLRNVTKTFPGGTVGVAGLNLEIRPGTVYGLMGRNGAGKTTTIRLLMGLLRPDEGEALVLGENMWNAGRSVRARISYVSQSEQMPSWMTFRDLSRYVGNFYDHWNAAFAENLAIRWGISSLRPLAALSGGEQRKAAIVLALAPEPDVLILDEPAAGLDPVSRRELVSEVVSVLNRQTDATILFSTHIISDLERVAERVGVIERGRIVLNRPLDQLQSCFRKVQVIFPGETAPPRFVIPGANHCSVAGPVVTGVTEFFDAEHMDALKRWPGVRLQTFPLSLEEIFIEVSRSEEVTRDQPILAEEDNDQEEKIVCL
ncbi:MAG TPA: ABC transporter ATP-binding protein [Verrucomicrobiae bacterium]|nr:ABC transporter ATP-binding protein [Verrucomicrobiae bacterium]